MAVPAPRLPFSSLPASALPYGASLLFLPAPRSGNQAFSSAPRLRRPLARMLGNRNSDSMSGS